MAYLGIDMGGTATRWVLVDHDGGLIERGSTRGGTALVYDAKARQSFSDVLSDIRSSIERPVFAATLGLTGSGLKPDVEHYTLISQALDLHTQSILALNDVVLAWHTSFPTGGPGHLIVSGTGSVGLSISQTGEITLVGGRGALIDDAGSGAWIALRALDLVWRAIDEHGRAVGVEKLASALFAHMGGDDWDTTRCYVYGQDRGAIGTLATAVADAAQAGDTVALELLSRAGRELARLATALTARCGTAPIRATGGVFNLHPVVAQSMNDHLAPDRIECITLDAALHAAMMARERHVKGST